MKFILCCAAVLCVALSFQAHAQRAIARPVTTQAPAKPPAAAPQGHVQPPHNR